MKLRKNYLGYVEDRVEEMKLETNHRTVIQTHTSTYNSLRMYYARCFELHHQPRMLYNKIIITICLVVAT